MAVDYFLKIDGVPGESADDKHKGEIEVLSFSWGVSNPGPAGPGGGAAAGRASFQDFHFVARTSKASPKLFLACASGQHVPSALFTARRAGKPSIEFLKIKLREVLVSSFQVGGSEPDQEPLDQVSLNFGKVEMEYRPIGLSGKLEAPIVAGWDVKKNKKL
jgi:type VI secretion system secreted protein Hcp